MRRPPETELWWAERIGEAMALAILIGVVWLMATAWSELRSATPDAGTLPVIEVPRSDCREASRAPGREGWEVVVLECPVGEDAP